MALSQGNLTFVLLHRTALRNCVGNTFDLFSGILKGCDEHVCAVYYWQASQRNSHFIWNPGVVWGTGRGLIPAKLQGM